MVACKCRGWDLVPEESCVSRPEPFLSRQGLVKTIETFPLLESCLVAFVVCPQFLNGEVNLMSIHGIVGTNKQS